MPFNSLSPDQFDADAMFDVTKQKFEDHDQMKQNSRCSDSGSIADDSCSQQELSQKADPDPEIQIPLPEEPIIDDDVPPPAFTKEQEQAELASLTIDEIVKVEKDLRGIQAITTGVDSMGMNMLKTVAGDMSVASLQTVAASSRMKNASRNACTTIRLHRGRGRPRGSGRSKNPPIPHDACTADDMDVRRLNQELDRVDKSLKVAYAQALVECPELLSRDRKVAFLEREDLNAHLAALRLASYWNIRYATFGPNRCFLPMTLDGAMQDEVKDMIRYSAFHILPSTDMSGRGVLFFNPRDRRLDQYPVEREARALFYLMDTLSTYPSIRRAGFVGLSNYRDVDRSKVSYRQQRHMRHLFDCMPIKIRSTHICHPSPLMHYVAYPVLRHILGREVRLRTRLHYGDEEKVLQDLETCSLPRSCLPKELGGELTVSMAKWVSEQSVFESSLFIEAADKQHEEENATKKRSSKDLQDLHESLSSVQTEASGGSSNKSMKLTEVMEASGSSLSPKKIEASANDSAKLQHGVPVEISEVKETAEEARAAIIGSFNSELFKGGGDCCMLEPTTRKPPSLERQNTSLISTVGTSKSTTSDLCEQSKQFILGDLHDDGTSNEVVTNILAANISDDIFD